MSLKSVLSNKYVKLAIESAYNDNSTKLLIFSNLITIVFALHFSWNLPMLLFIYWCQSIIIGFFTFFKLLFLKTDSLLVTIVHGFFIVVFFTFSILWHIMYLSFIIVLFVASIQESGIGNIAIDPLDFLFIILSVMLFFINHLYSFLVHIKAFAKAKHSVLDVLFASGIRLIPILMAILFAVFAGGFFSGFLSVLGVENSKVAGFSFFVLLGFLIFKSFADILMHNREHKDEVAESSLSDII